MSDHLETTSAFLDGELDAAAAAEAERHIQACAQCQALLAAASEASELLRGPSARLIAPAGLKARVARALDQEEGATAAQPRRLRRGVASPRPFWLGAASGVGLSAIAATAILSVAPVMGGRDLTLALGDDHAEALMHSRTIAVVSTSHHTVKPWFAGRAPVSPAVVDHTDQGFALVGGRVATLAGRKAAVVVYRHGAHEIDLYAWARDDAALPAAGAHRRGYRILSWADADLAYAAVSDVDAGELARFVQLVRTARE